VSSRTAESSGDATRPSTSTDKTDADATTVARDQGAQETTLRASDSAPATASATDATTRRAAQTEDVTTRRAAQTEDATTQTRITPLPAGIRAASFRPGYRLRDRYVLDQMIGEGAMGQVWRAKDLLGEEALDRNPFVAVKVLNSDVETHPDSFVALHREASRAQKLAHPNIITVYVFDRDDRSGRAFIAMELLQGQPLDHVIRAAPGGLPRKRALPILRGLAEGLAYAHRRGLVHSDFKPANVFLTTEGVPKILDFGIARVVQTLESDATTSAAMDDDSGFRGYTPSYAAPEVMSGKGEPSTAEDVFALGLVAYELLTGKHPYNRLSSVEAQEAGLTPPFLRGLPRREARALQRAVAFDSRARQRDATAFLRELQGVPAIQKALAAAVAVLILAAGGLWYRNYVDSLPAQPLEQLPVQTQQDFRDKVQLGNESLAYLERTHDITASQDAAEYFADAYRLHPKDPLAVQGLKSAADRAIDWYSRQPDKAQVRAELEKFRDRSEYYKNYAPMVRAIRDAGGN
jgi:serine/threonine protein kinase